jgi:hypothetical protein
MTADAAFHRRPIGTIAAMLLAGATACTTAPVQGVVENLDQVTGTTVVVLSQPVELITEQNRGPTRDPFAFTAPFEIDRMGNRSLYLWISTPQDNGVVQHVQILCDGKPLALDPTSLNLKQVGLSRTPYALSAPWSGEHYFPLPESELQCLAGARQVSVVADLPSGTQDRFSTDGSHLRGLAAFAMRRASAAAP